MQLNHTTVPSLSRCFRKFPLLFILIPVLLACGLDIAQGQDRSIIVSNLNDSGPGSLRQAVQSAAPHGRIIINAMGTLVLTRGEIMLRKHLQITGPGADQFTISGNKAGRIFNVRAKAGISGVTLRDGSDATGGGAILVGNIGALTLSNCVVTGNAASTLVSDPGYVGVAYGGGVLNEGGSFTIIDSVIARNTAYAGAGLANQAGSMTLVRCVISNNVSETATGIHNRGSALLQECLITDNHSPNSGAVNNEGSMTIENSRIIGNSSSYEFASLGNGGTLLMNDSTVALNVGALGGGVYNVGTAIINRSTISGNIGGGYGGGALFNSAEATLNNCTLSGNSSSAGGAVVTLDVFHDPNTTPIVTTLNHCTIVSNTASGHGGGLANLGSVNGHNGDHVKNIIRNCILAGNSLNDAAKTASNATGPLVSEGCNLIGNDTGLQITGDTTHDLIGTSDSPVDPLLGPLQDNGGRTATHALLPSSPAIDASTCDPLPTDQRGVPRPQGIAADIGAFELQP